MAGFGQTGVTAPLVGSGGPGATGTAGGNLISPTIDPTFLRLLEQAQSAIPTNLPSVRDIASQGSQSPLLEAVLGPALQRLLAPQAEEREQLTAANRAAGGLRGSQYANNLTKLINQQGLQRNDLISNIIAKTLGTLVSGQLQENQQAFNPTKALSELLGISRPTYVPEGGAATTLGGQRRSSSGWESIAPSLGLGTPMLGDTMESTQTRLNNIGRSSGGGGMVGGSMPAPARSAPASGYDPLSQYLLEAGSSGAGANIEYDPTSGRFVTTPSSSLGYFTEPTIPTYEDILAFENLSAAGEY